MNSPLYTVYATNGAGQEKVIGTVSNKSAAITLAGPYLDAEVTRSGRAGERTVYAHRHASKTANPNAFTLAGAKNGAVAPKSKTVAPPSTKAPRPAISRI